MEDLHGISSHQGRKRSNIGSTKNRRRNNRPQEEEEEFQQSSILQDRKYDQDSEDSATTTAIDVEQEREEQEQEQQHRQMLLTAMGLEISKQKREMAAAEMAAGDGGGRHAHTTSVLDNHNHNHEDASSGAPSTSTGQCPLPKEDSQSMTDVQQQEEQPTTSSSSLFEQQEEEEEEEMLLRWSFLQSCCHHDTRLTAELFRRDPKYMNQVVEWATQKYLQYQRHVTTTSLFFGSIPNSSGNSNTAAGCWTFANLSQTSRDMVNAGCFQVLPQTDQAGRTVVAIFPQQLPPMMPPPQHGNDNRSSSNPSKEYRNALVRNDRYFCLQRPRRRTAFLPFLFSYLSIAHFSSLICNHSYARPSLPFVKLGSTAIVRTAS